MSKFFRRILPFWGLFLCSACGMKQGVKADNKSPASATVERTSKADSTTVERPSKEALVTEKTVRDGRGNIIERSYRDQNGQFIQRPRYGYARTTIQYNAKNKVVERAYFDVGGRPALRQKNVHDYSKMTIEYDANGNPIEVAYYDQKGVLLTGNGTHYKKTQRFDAANNMVEMVLYFSKGVRKTTQYNGAGKKVMTTYANAEGLVLGRAGYAVQKWQYTGLGQISETTFWGVDGQPALSKRHGFAKQITDYNSNGDKIKVSLWGIDDKPTLSRGGHYSTVEMIYNADGRLVETQYRGRNGEPAKKGRRGYFRETISYHHNGTIKEKTTHDLSNNPMRTVLYSEKGIKQKTIRHRSQK